MNDTTRDRPMRLCLLGCGRVAESHSRTLRGLGRSFRLSYASRSIGKARALKEKFGGEGAFGSYEEAIASPSVDAVAVLTPPASHLALAVAALDAGRDVILEKPPVLRSSDFDALERACGAHGRHVYVAENYFYKPVLSRLRRILAAGTIGEALFIHLNAVKRQKTAGWRNDHALAGGGALFEGGIHWVNFAGSLGFTIRAVRAVRPGRVEGREGPERSMALLIDYAEGPAGLLSYSWEVASPLKGIRFSRIYGREGSIVFESNGLLLATSGRHWRVAVPGLSDVQGYRAMFADFLRAWQRGEEAQMTLARARRDVEVVEEAYRSAGLEPSLQLT